MKRQIDHQLVFGTPGVRLKTLPVSEHEGVPSAEAHIAADLIFAPDERLPAHPRPATLVLTARGLRVNGYLVVGRHLFRGTGAIEDAEGTLSLRFSATGIGDAAAISFGLAFPLARGENSGVFACATVAANFGGFLQVFCWQEQDPLARCGNLLSRQDITFSDPDGKHVTRYRYLHFERCNFIWRIDEQDKRIGEIIELTNDKAEGGAHTSGGVTVTPVKAPLISEPIGEGETRSGHIRIFYVEGCISPRVTQYAKSGVTFNPPPESPGAQVPADDVNDWHRDGADPYAGAQINSSGHIVSSDIPAVYEHMMAQADDIKSLPSGATATYTWSLETFFFCNGRLLAWVSWGAQVTFTMGADGKLTPGAPVVNPPQFYGPGEYSHSGGNPKPN